MDTGNERPTYPPIVTFELLGADALQAMLDDELAEASRIMGRRLPSFFLEEKWLWEIRRDQLHRSPGDAPWLVRAVVLQPVGTVVGHAGFHGPPDEAGTVEVGYTIAPDHRGNGLCACRAPGPGGGGDLASGRESRPGHRQPGQRRLAGRHPPR